MIVAEVEVMPEAVTEVITGVATGVVKVKLADVPRAPAEFADIAA